MNNTSNFTEVNTISINNFTDPINDAIGNISLADIIDNVITNPNITELTNNSISLNVTRNFGIEPSTRANATTESPKTINSTSTGLPTFYLSMIIVVAPGTFAHTIAIYCLAQDVKKNMPLVKQLLLALSVIDVLGLCSISVHHAVLSFVTDPPIILCSLNSFFSGFLPLMSGALTTLMAVERCIKFRAPFWHSVNLWSWKLKVPIVMTTILLITVALFPMSGLGYIMSQDGRRHCSTIPTTVTQMYDSPEGIYIITYGIVGLITVFVDVTCNIATIMALFGVTDKRSEMSESREGKNAEMAMTQMLFWLSLTFLVTLSPLYGSLIILYSGIPLSRSMKIVTHFLAGLNFTLDPFIYIIMMKTYRKRVKNLLCCNRKDSVANSGSSYHVNSSSTTPNL